MTSLENCHAYFASKNEAYACPKVIYKTMLAEPDSFVVVDVRNPVARIPSRIPSRIPGSVRILEEGIQARMDELPRENPAFYTAGTSGTGSRPRRQFRLWTQDITSESFTAE